MRYRITNPNRTVQFVDATVVHRTSIGLPHALGWAFQLEPRQTREVGDDIFNIDRQKVRLVPGPAATPVVRIGRRGFGVLPGTVVHCDPITIEPCVVSGRVQVGWGSSSATFKVTVRAGHSGRVRFRLRGKVLRSLKKQKHPVRGLVRVVYGVQSNCVATRCGGRRTTFGVRFRYSR